MKIMRSFAVLGGLALSFASAGCGGSADGTPEASVEESSALSAGISTSASGFQHQDVSGTSGVAYVGDGYANVTPQADGTVILDLFAYDLPPGQHAVHIHQSANCNAPGPDWTVGTSDVGDLGNIRIQSDGSGRLSAKTSLWSTTTGAANDVIGHALVVHVKRDPLSGPATARAEACDVIRVVETAPTPPPGGAPGGCGNPVNFLPGGPCHS